MAHSYKIAITGTTRGIGEALAARLSQTHSIVHLNRPEIDLSDFDLLNKLDLSDIDVLVLNAGVLDKNIINFPFEMHDFDKWKYIIDCNLIGNLCLIQQYIKQRTQGIIIYISGATVTRRREGSTSIVHTLSKKAMSNFVEDIRYELHSARKSIRIVDIKPGLTRKDKNQIDSSRRIPTSYQEISNGIEFAITNSSILNIDFEKHEPMVQDLTNE